MPAVLFLVSLVLAGASMRYLKHDATLVCGENDVTAKTRELEKLAVVIDPGAKRGEEVKWVSVRHKGDPWQPFRVVIRSKEELFWRRALLCLLPVLRIRGSAGSDILSNALTGLSSQIAIWAHTSQ
jgi:hypothetical protein